MPPSVGRVSAAEQPAEVDACTHFGRHGDSTCARLRVSGRPANRVIRDRTRPQRTGESHAHPRRARDRPIPLGGDWLLAHPRRRRRLRRREGVDALVPELLDSRPVRLPGWPAHTGGARRGSASAGRRRLPHRWRRDQGSRTRAGDAPRGRHGARFAVELLLLDAQPGIPLARPPYHVHGALPARAGNPHHQQRCGCHPSCGGERAARRDHGRRDRPRSARGSIDARIKRRLQRPRGGPGRRPRRTGDPAVRLRNASGRADPARRRGGGDPEHVHARLGPHLRHQRLDRRPVPDRARRARGRGRLRLADDLPLPRRAARRTRRRAGAGRDRDARWPVRDRLRLDSRRRLALDARAAGAVHPFDRHRRHAHPRRLGAGGDHAPPSAPGGAGRTDQQRSRAAEGTRRPRPSRGRRLGPLGAVRSPSPATDRLRRHHDRRCAGRARHATEPARAAAEEHPWHRDRDRGRRCSRTRASHPG